MLPLLASLVLAQEAPSPEAPKSALILFDGTSTDAWVHRGSGKPCEWEIADGELRVNTMSNDIVTKEKFGDFRLHLEFWLPLMPAAKDQGRANSGVYSHGRYEVQILDNYENKTYQFGGCGAIYGQKDPDVDAILPPERWNTYDIALKAAVLDSEGVLLKKPRITVWHNGKLIHKDVEIEQPFTTAGIEGPWVAEGPIMLQNHGNPVRFRNIWLVREGRGSD